MPESPALSVKPGHFSEKSAVLAEIARDNLWPVTVHQGAFPPAPVHCHSAPVRIYIFTGEFRVTDDLARPFLNAGPGTRVDIPAGAPHTVCADGHVVTITAFASSADAAGLPQLPLSGR